jgi:hypothetical protein
MPEIIDPKSKAKVLYDEFSSNYDLGKFDDFYNKLQDNNKRKLLYDAVSKDYDLGTFEDFSNKVVSKKKVSPLQAPSPSSATPSLSQYIQKGREQLEVKPDKSLSQTSVFNPELSDFQKYEQSLSRKATAYNWANSPTKAAAEPRVAGNPVAAILNMFSPDKMAESYGAIGKDIEKRENIRQNAEVEYKKYEEESNNYAKNLLPTIKETVSQYSGKLNKNGVPDYGKISQLSRQLSSQLGGGDYVSEVIRGQLENQERFAIIEPSVKKEYEKIVKKEKGLSFWLNVQPTERKKIENSLIQKQLVTAQKIKQAETLASTEYKKTELEATERYKPLIAAAQINGNEEELNGIVNQYYTEMKGIAAKINNRVKRTRDELVNQFNSEIQKAQLSENEIKYLNDTYQKAYSNVVKGDLESKKIIQQKEEKLIGYTGIFGKSFLSGLLSGISNRGSGLVGIGLGGSLSDFLYSFKSGAEITETVDLDFKGNMFNPTTYLTRLGKQVGYQLPSMVVTALTKNPTIGGMVGFVDEQLQNGGDVYEQILSETGDPVKAQQATARYWYRSLPTIPLYYLESSMFLKYTGLKKGNVLANVVAEVPVEVTQELIQGYSQQLDTKDALGFKDFMSQKAPNIALETAITTLLQGGSFAALGKLGSALGNQNELGKNYIYNLLNSKGTNAAFAMLELQQLNGQITEEQLLLGKENLAKVASTITELKAVGLNDTQVEGYLALLAERDGLRENLTKTSNPELISAYQKEIESINKELEQAALGKVKATTVEFTSGGKITLLGDPKSVLSSTKKEVGNTINITSTDDSVNKEVQDINSKIPQQENEELSNKIIDLQVNLAEVGVFPLDQDGMLTFTDQEGNQIEEQALPQEALELKEVYDRLNGNVVSTQEPTQEVEKDILKEPTEEEKLADINKGNTVTFTYEKESDVPAQLKSKISSKGESNGKPFVRVTISKVEADYLLGKEQKPKTEQEIEPAEQQLLKEQIQPTETKTKEEFEIKEKQNKEVEETASKLKSKGLFKTDESKGIGKLVPKKFYDKKKSAFQIVSEAYNEAKRDKSNPELVKAVNDFLDEESGRLPKDLKGRRVGNKKYAAGKDHIKGRTITKRTPTGQKVKGTYKLVPAAQLVPSHNPISFSKNEAFPQNESGKTINDRDYEKNEADKTAVIGFAQNLDGRAVENTPWVSKEGIVYNGNNRTMSRQLAAKNNTDKEYLNQLKEQAEMYGFTEEQVESMENPTLVFEVEENLPFTTKVWKMFNAEEKKEETPGAFAIAISKTISDKARRELSKLYEEAEVPSDVTSDKKMFKRALDILVQDGVIQAIEIPKYSDNGTATPEGVALLERVVLGASLDENAIETLMSLSMGNIKNAILKNIVGLMLNSTKGENSLIPDITGAIAILKKAKVLKSSVLDFLVAFDIFDENQWTLSEMALALLLDLNSPNKLKEFLSAYNQDVGQQLMFGDSTKEGIITNLIYNIIPEHEKGKKVIERVAERGTDETGKGTESPNRKDEEKEQLMTGKVPNRISRKAFDKLVEKLQKAFPKAKITFNANDVKGKAATKVKTQGGIIYGATLPDGTIYLNREAMSAEAPIHEFTHLWERLMPEDWKKGLEFFKKSSGFAKALKEIQDNPAYKDLTQEQKESEAMNTILGRMGEGYFSSDMLTKFKNWFTQLLKKVADKLNLRKLTPDEKFESFANKVLGDLFEGKDITEKQEVKKGDLQLMKIGGKEVQVRRLPEQLDVVNGFYSPLEKMLLETKFDKLPVKQWIEKFGKSEEAKWTGLSDWLSQQQGSVSKADIQQYLKDNRISVVEVVKGGQNDDLMNRAEEAERKFGIDIIIDENPMDGSPDVQISGKKLDDMTDDAIQELQNEVTDFVMAAAPETKFSQYQLEGEKENYKEILVTLPKAKPFIIGRTSGFDTLEYTKNVYGINSIEYSNMKNAVQSELEEKGLKWSEIKTLFEDYESKPSDFKSTHFDEPNIIVHLRMNTRKDSQGNKVLFLEEIQSDFGQSYKKEQGSKKAIIYDIAKDIYNSKKRGDKAQFESAVKKAKDKGISEKQVSDALSEYGDFTKPRPKEIPDAPFVTDTNAWTKLALKVALKEAVKQGADKISWTTGEQQNERYDLSKQVDEIKVLPQYGGSKMTYGVQGFKNGEMSTAMAANSIAELEGIIGKELAKKVADKGEFEGELSFTGNDLKVGGKGMKGFYGSTTEGSLGIVGNVAKSLFKQEPKTVDINANDKTTQDKIDAIEKKREIIGARREQINKEMPQKRAKNKTEQDLIDKYVKEYKKLGEEFEQYEKDILALKSTQYSIDITPELKQQVSEGLPLFMASVSKEDFTEALNEYDNLIKNPKGTTEYIKKFGLEKIKKIKDITSNFGTYIAALEKSNYITKKIC